MSYEKHVERIKQVILVGKP